MQASDAGAGFHTPAVSPVFVNIVARMQDNIDGLIAGNRVIGIEMSERIVRAGNKRDSQPVQRTCRQCFRPAGGRDLAGGGEAIIIGRTGHKAVRDDLHRMVGGGACSGIALKDDIREFRIAGEDPADRLCLGGRRYAGPQDDAFVLRVAAGDTMGKGSRTGQSGRGCLRCRTGPNGSCGNQGECLSAIQCGHVSVLGLAACCGRKMEKKMKKADPRGPASSGCDMSRSLP